MTPFCHCINSLKAGTNLSPPFSGIPRTGTKNFLNCQRTIWTTGSKIGKQFSGLKKKNFWTAIIGYNSLSNEFSIN